MRLQREIGLVGAVGLGLGSMVGTGVFVSLGIGAGVAGSTVLLAVALAAGVATCNGLSSAQLAASHPVSGGTYEYGYRYLKPWLGFSAGWMFMLAKSASAATAALGLAGYALEALGLSEGLRVPLALLAVALLTALVLGGMRRANLANGVIVAITLATLAWLVVGSSGAVDGEHLRPLLPSEAGGWRALLEATALMFVAYTGYGRIATLGEEVREPRRTIPLAIAVTMVVTMVLYVAVAAVGVGVLGAPDFAAATVASAAPLTAVADRAELWFGAELMTLGALTAMLGVLLNLLLGLSRVLLAMGRRGDAPRAFGLLNAEGTTPTFGVLGSAALVAVLTAFGDVRATWSFSAFTVLVYYSITNLATLRLAPEDRLYPRWVSVLGLAACASLATQVDRASWSLGLGLLAAGLVWHALRARRRQS